MALQKQPVPINFSQGLDLKTDSKQVAPGKFLALENTVFDKGGLLQKRNGNAALTPLPDASNTYLTTFNGNLTALGSTLQAYSSGSGLWVSKGALTSTQVETLPLIRSSTNQSQADTAVAANGLVLTVYTDNVTSGSTTVPVYKYAIADSITGQNIVAPSSVVPSSGVVSGSPRAFLLGSYFIILFPSFSVGTFRIQYQAISTVNPAVIVSGEISSRYLPVAKPVFDAVVANNSLYVAFNGSDGGGAVRVTYLDSTLVLHNTVVYAGESLTDLTIAADITQPIPVVYVTYYNSGTSTARVLAVDSHLNAVLAPTTFFAGQSIANLASYAQNQSLGVIYEVNNNYSYDSAVPTHFLRTKSISQAGVIGTETVLARSVGLASKAIIANGVPYFLAVYFSNFQPTYFLMNNLGQIVAKLAYANGSGYYTLGLPSIELTGNNLQFAYFFKDLISSVNKTLNIASAAGVYSQLGINLATITLSSKAVVSAEIGNDLNISGGILWMYDGYSLVEQGFHVYPDNVEVTTSGAGGLITAQQYFYQVTYEWSDNQGNVFRSAPSIPFSVTTVGAISSNTVNVPTLRLTYKTANPVTIVIYRWSTAQQIFYRITSVQAPIINDTSVDSIAYVDTQADSSIIGNSILYTTGGVIENIGPPAASSMTLFQSRLFLVDAEDKNLLWYSKQVIEHTPVEMSDLFTIYVAPTAAAQGSTGPITALSALDDKLIIFKKNAIYYITGAGPDNTGANSQFSEPVFITSTVGCTNQHSIVFMPQGLMFQSDKGIWLLGRDLSTNYIGAAVDDYNSATVLSSANIPATNQVRFILDTGVTLMYDYYFGQWGTFVGIPAIASTLFQGLHTFLNAAGAIYQESPGKYLDGSRPVVMRFTTGWLNLAGLQGYERAYFFYLLGTYISPHKLALSIAYDYNPNPTQTSTISPDNYTAPWGGQQLWGSAGLWGGPGNIEQWRVFLQQQKCEAFQITLQEQFDPSFGTVAGAGFTLSGLNLVIGVKSGYPRLRASRSIG